MTDEQTDRDFAPDEVWPERGSTDYLLETVCVSDVDSGEITWQASVHSTGPVSSQIHETEFWCRDCGVGLPDYTKGEP